MIAFSIILVSLLSFTAAQSSIDHSKTYVEPKITSEGVYCEYDDATIRNKSIRYTRCWKPEEKQETIERNKQ